MDTITAVEAQKKGVAILNDFIELKALYPDKPVKMYATVENISFYEMILLYYKLNTPKKRLLLPEELDEDYMCLIYRPAPGCVISFETDRCARVMPHIIHSQDGPYIKSDFKKWKNKFCMN